MISIPSGPANYNVAVPQAQDPLAQMGKMLSLKSLMGEQQLQPLQLQEQQQRLSQQRQMAPLQVQQAQQGVQASTLENQQRELELKSQQSMMKAWTDPEFTGNVTGAVGKSTSSDQAFDPDAMIKGLVSRGVLPKDAISTASSFTELSKNAAMMTKDQLSNYKDSHDQLFNMLAPIVDMKGPEAATALNAIKQKLAASPLPGLDPVDTQLLQSADLTHLPAMLGVMGFTGKLFDYHKAQAENMKAGLEVAPPTKDQLDTFTKQTIPSFAALKPEQKNAYTAEAKTARTVPELNAIVARADATDKAEQMHADSLAQTKAMVGNKFGDAGLTANEKIWTDPAHGFAGALAQAKQTKASIVAGADGNGLLTSMVPTMEVLGVNHAAGISRISPQEAMAAGAPGGWAERWNAWATKSATGKLTPRLAEEGQQLMDVVLDAAHTKALTSSALIAQGHGLTPAQTPAMDKNGNVTTLDKVIGGGAQPAAIPAEATHIGPDGKPYKYKGSGDKTDPKNWVVVTK
jgi:hypothetical protein